MIRTLIILATVILWPINYILFNNFPSVQTPETIFTRDYEAEQLVIRNTQLYNNIPMARLMHNKARIYLDKFAFNFFSLGDPNYYFFGGHPRPIVPDNKNLFKFPFLSIIFFAYGIYFIRDHKYAKLLGIFTAVTIITLSFLKNFDGYDILLWIPISFVIIFGIRKLEKNHPRLFLATGIIFLFFALPEIIRSFYVLK